MDMESFINIILASYHRDPNIKLSQILEEFFDTNKNSQRIMMPATSSADLDLNQGGDHGVCCKRGEKRMRLVDE